MTASDDRSRPRRRGLLLIALAVWAVQAAPAVATAAPDPAGPAAAFSATGTSETAASGPVGAETAWIAAGSRADAWPLGAPRKARSWVAKPLAPARGRTRLRGGRARVVGTRTSWSRQALILLVLGSAELKGERWIKLRLGSRPNGSAAWFPRDRFVIRKTRYWVRVNLSGRRVAVYRKGRLARRFRAVIGAPATPTPRGLGALYEINRQPNPRGFLGPWALSLTFHSNVLDNYGGGPGRVAIHGRAGASLIDPLGSARSHGCIRVDNRLIRWMARHVPKGTPVRIRG